MDVGNKFHISRGIQDRTVKHFLNQIRNYVLSAERFWTARADYFETKLQPNVAQSAEKTATQWSQSNLH